MPLSENEQRILRQIEEQLHHRRERWGYSYHVLQADRAHDFAPIVERLTGR